MIFFTSNQNKIKEAQEILGIKIEQRICQFDELQDTDPQATALFKYNHIMGTITDFLVEDSGLYLGKKKEIGALIKWLPNDRVVKAYLGEPAIAVCVFVYKGKIFEGQIKGKIVEPRGENGFGWDNIFEVNGKTFAEMTSKEKNDISPRYKALMKLKVKVEK